MPGGLSCVHALPDRGGTAVQPLLRRHTLPTGAMSCASYETPACSRAIP